MPGRAKRAGVVEVDDMFVGGRNKPGMAGRSRRRTRRRCPAMAEVRSRGPSGAAGRWCFPDWTGPRCVRLSGPTSSRGQRVRSDGLVVLGQSMDGFVHDRNVRAGHRDTGTRPVPGRVEGAGTEPNDGWKELLRGAAEPSTCRSTSTGSSFRFNHRKAGKSGLLFYRLLGQAVHTDRRSCNDIAIGGTTPAKTATKPPVRVARTTAKPGSAGRRPTMAFHPYRPHRHYMERSFS